MLVGLSFLLFLAAVGLGTLGMAVSIAVAPSERKVVAFRPMSVCTVMAILGSTAAGLAGALKHAADSPGTAATPGGPAALYAGLAESMVPALAGFSLLAIAWLLVSYGVRRQAGRSDSL